jgi:hypothetical protein
MGKFNKKNTFMYESSVDTYPNIIVPAKTTLPKWYKDQPRYINNMPDQGSFKMCPPFLDLMTCGYMVTTPYDLLFENNENGPQFRWRHPGEGTIVSRPNESVDNIPVPKGYLPYSFGIKTKVAFKVPKGYSVIASQPFNRHDLPFLIFSVLIDGDFALLPNATVTFLIREDFSGVIPQGTPLMQLIPFKVEDWESKVTPGLCEEGELNGRKSASTFFGWYKKNVWKRKNYD